MAILACLTPARAEGGAWHVTILEDFELELSGFYSNATREDSVFYFMWCLSNEFASDNPG
jgi:hypothetical protein